MKETLRGILSNRTFQVVFLIYSSLLIFLGRQLDRGIMNFDDAYYAQKAKEIFSSDSIWVVLWKGSLSFDNPPLPFWLTGLAYKVFGVSGYAAVFSSAIFGLLVVYLTYGLCHYLYRDNWTSFLSAFVLLFPGMFLDAARRGMLDITLAFFVTSAMYCLLKGLENKKFYLLYGVVTGCAVLTKSVLGFFPIVIGTVFMLWHGGLKKLFSPLFLAGTIIAVLLGCSWYAVNWSIFGDAFIQGHFHASHMKIMPGQSFSDKPLYLFGYFKDILKNYWPWLPVTVTGFLLFARRAFREKDAPSMFLLLWVAIPFLILSTSRNQTLRYLFMIYPALAIITARTLTGWLKDSQKEKALPWMIGIIMATVLVVNVSPVKARVSLDYNSAEVRDIAPFVRANTPEKQGIFFYRLSPWDPTQALMFYSNRFVRGHASDPKKLFRKMKADPSGTWLSSISDFKSLEQDYPGKLYLIYGNQRYAYFTSMQNRKNVVYDLSGMKIPVIR